MCWDAIIWCTSSVAPHQGTRWPCCAGESSQLPASRHRQYLAWPGRGLEKHGKTLGKIHLKWIEMEAHGPSRRFKPKLFAFTLCSDGCWRSKEKFPLGLSDEDHVQRPSLLLDQRGSHDNFATPTTPRKSHLFAWPYGASSALWWAWSLDADSIRRPIRI